jgi:hypothetical protein
MEVMKQICWSGKSNVKQGGGGKQGPYFDFRSANYLDSPCIRI